MNAMKFIKELYVGNTGLSATECHARDHWCFQVFDEHRHETDMDEDGGFRLLRN